LNPDAVARLRGQSLTDFLTLAALWGSSFLFMRLSAQEFGALPTAGLRVAGASLFLLPMLLWRGQWPALRAHYRPILFVGLLNSGIPFALLAWAVLSISTGMAAILNATVPLFGALVAWVWLKDRPGTARLLGLAVGFVGVALLGLDKASFQSGGGGWAVLACLGATLCYGIAASFTKRYLTGVHPLATATGSQIGATLGLALPTIWLWPPKLPGPPAWAAVVALAVLCSGIAYVLYFRLIETVGPARALAVTFLVPVFALAYGVLLLDESLAPWMLGCGAVIALGTALSTGLLRLPGKRS
jgi:drug/metabolite transporter (DMT)-like permease